MAHPVLTSGFNAVLPYSRLTELYCVLSLLFTFCADTHTYLGPKTLDGGPPPSDLSILGIFPRQFRLSLIS